MPGPYEEYGPNAVPGIYGQSLSSSPPPPPQWGTSTAGTQFGLSALQMASQTVPNALWGGAMLAGAMAPIGMWGFQSAAKRWGATGLQYLDPGQWVFDAGSLTAKAGYRGGYGLGSMMFGAGRMASLAGYTGGALGFAATALPVGLAAYGAYRGLDYAQQQVYQGGLQNIAGQAFANQIMPSVLPNQSPRMMGGGMGAMLGEVSKSTGLQMEEITKYAQDLNSQRVFQAVKSVKEFQTKFKEVMGALKEISLSTQSSMDEALQTFQTLRSQGFYKTADMTAQAAKMKAREASTGISYGTYAAVGDVGAQAARARGLSGRVGADFTQQSVAATSLAVKQGLISEERIQEMGGVETVGVSLAQAQMGFLSSARGRAFIAATMGAGRRPNEDRLESFLGGRTLEDLVTTASGRGLGVLHAAGTKEAKEAMLPYAGMAMMSMAMMQQRQLFGGSSSRGLYRMLGTMGLSRGEADALIGQTLALPDQIQREQTAGQNIQNEVAFRFAENEQSWSRKLSRRLTPWDNYFRGVGSSIYNNTSASYQRFSNRLWGGIETELAGDEMFQRAIKNRESILRGGSGIEAYVGGRGPFGIETGPSLLGYDPNEDLRTRYRGHLKTSGGEEGDIYVGQGKYINRSKISEIEKMRSSPISEIDTIGATLALTRSGFEDSVEKGVQTLQSIARSKNQTTANFEAALVKRRQYMDEAKQAPTENAAAAKRNWATFETIKMGFYTAQLEASKLLDATSQYSSIIGGIGGERSGTLDEYRRLSAAYEIIKDTLPPGETLERFAQREDRESYIARAKKEAEKRGNKEAVRILSPGGAEGALLSRDLMGARQRTAGSLENFLKNQGTTETIVSGRTVSGGRNLGDYSPVTTTTTMSAHAKDLQTKLNQNIGQSQNKFMLFVEALEKFNAAPDDAGGLDRVLRLKGELEETLGKGTGASKEIQAMYDKMTAGKGFTKDKIDFIAQAKQLGSAFEERAYREKVSATSGGVKNLLGRIDKKEIAADENTRLLLEQFFGATSSGKLEQRADLEKQLLSNILKDKTISRDEIEILQAVGAGGGGRHAGQFLDDLLSVKSSKGGKAIAAAYKGLGLSEEDVQGIVGTSGDARLSKVTQLLEKINFTADAFGDPGGGAQKTIDGVFGTYVEANTRFVQAVEQFIGKLPEDIRTRFAQAGTDLTQPPQSET